MFALYFILIETVQLVLYFIAFKGMSQLQIIISRTSSIKIMQKNIILVDMFRCL